MNSAGAKIRNLRMRANLTQAQLAEEIGSTAKSIQRYESDKCCPETYTLQKLSEFFGVPIDFLLGSDTAIVRHKKDVGKGIHCSHYERYLQCKTHYQIDSSAEYLWIYLDDDGLFGGQSEWVGWADKDRKIEIRRLRVVIPENAVQLCTNVFGPPMVINHASEVDLFLTFGGHAIIKADICKQYLPEFYENYTGPNPERENINIIK